MNRNQRRNLQRFNQKPKNVKAIQIDAKAKKIAEIKEKTVKTSIRYSIAIGIILAVVIILWSCSSEKPICDAYH
jgi:hypothetical protein